MQKKLEEEYPKIKKKLKKIMQIFGGLMRQLGQNLANNLKGMHQLEHTINHIRTFC